MITLRASNERGHANHGWLDSYHTFSFARYIDRNHMGYRSLRVINEDVVAGATGFGMHPHDNMEIFTYMVEGGLTHKDTAGNSATIHPGQVQYMSAGSGIAHSEHNASKHDPAHLLQIWIYPSEPDTEPRYEDKDFTAALDSGKLTPIVTKDGREGSIKILQDAYVYAARPKSGTVYTHNLEEGRGAWLQVIHGTVDLNGKTLNPGDGASVEKETVLTLTAKSDGEFLLFDLK